MQISFDADTNKGNCQNSMGRSLLRTMEPYISSVGGCTDAKEVRDPGSGNLFCSYVRNRAFLCSRRLQFRLTLQTVDYYNEQGYHHSDDEAAR